MKSIIKPEVNVRMAVLDIMAATGLNEIEVLNSLSERLLDNYVNSKGVMYLRHGNYRLDHRTAEVYLWAVMDGEIKWDHAIDEVLDDCNKRIEVSIPFEQFNFQLPELRLILDSEDLIDFRKYGLLDKWKFGRACGDEEHILHKELEANCDKPSKKDRRVRQICKVISNLGYRPLDIPDGGKQIIKKECLHDARHFTDSTFDAAWKVARKLGRIKTHNHDKYIN